MTARETKDIEEEKIYFLITQTHTHILLSIYIYIYITILLYIIVEQLVWLQ